MNYSLDFVVSSPASIENIHPRSRTDNFLLLCLVVSYLIVDAWYLRWRVTDSLNLNALWLAIPLLLAEIYSYFGNLMCFSGMWRFTPRSPESFDRMTPSFPFSEWPAVDVFLTRTTLNPENVRAKVKAALALDYPRDKLRVYLLDKKNSPEIRAALERLCLNDLNPDLLPQEAEFINSERVELLTRLQKLKELVSESKKAEEFLQSFQLQVQTESEALSTLLSWFERLQPQFISHQTWLECKIILAEAFDNVVCHAHQGLPKDTPIEIEVKISSQYIELKIWDCGPAFDLEKYLLLDLETIDANAERGRGLSIIKQLVNRMSYTKVSEKQNCFSVEKFYPAALDPQKQPQSDFMLGYLQILPKLVVFDNSKSQNFEDYLNNQIEVLEREVEQKEKQLIRMSRCTYVAIENGSDRDSKNILNGFSGEFVLILNSNFIIQADSLKKTLPHFYRFNFQEQKYEKNDIGFVGIDENYVSVFFKEHASGELATLGKRERSLNNIFLRREALISMGFPDSLDRFFDDRMFFWRLESKSPFLQKIRNLQTIYGYLSGFFTAVLMACPIVYFFTQITPVTAYDLDFAIHFIPAFALDRAAIFVACRGMSKMELWHSQRDAAAMFPAYIRAVWHLLWRNAPAQPELQSSRFQHGFAWLHLTVFCLSALGIVFCFYFFINGTLDEPGTHLFYVAWATYNLFILEAIVRIALWRPKIN